MVSLGNTIVGNSVRNLKAKQRRPHVPVRVSEDRDVHFSNDLNTGPVRSGVISKGESISGGDYAEMDRTDNPRISLHSVVRNAIAQEKMRQKMKGKASGETTDRSEESLEPRLSEPMPWTRGDKSNVYSNNIRTLEANGSNAISGLTSRKSSVQLEPTNLAASSIQLLSKHEDKKAKRRFEVLQQSQIIRDMGQVDREERQILAEIE